MSRIIIACIRAYQAIQRSLGNQRLPLLIPSGCRAWPTCSEYTIQEIQEHGILRGCVRGAARVVKCNPLVKVK